MKESKESLREKIRKHFKENHPDYEPKFYIQGSYKMGNGIRYNDDMADLDDGVYFTREPNVSPTTLQKWVYEAVSGQTKGGQEHKSKCIRVEYKGDYHIDLPIFYKLEGEHPYLAVKNHDWGIQDDPKELVEWVNTRKDQNGQLNRIIKYLKAWGDNVRHRMPTGLCMTILAEANLHYDEREDISLQKTLENIQDDVNSNWECRMPTFPYENLFEGYDDTFERNFKETLKNFVDDAKEAINIADKKKACELWKKHLGNRFPDCDEKKSTSNLSSSALGEKISGNRPWLKIKNMSF